MRKQKGAVLIVSMILLMVITILATEGMKTSTMQVVMARNYQNSATAFMWAENGLAAGGQELRTDFEGVKNAYIANGNSYFDSLTMGPTSFEYELTYYDEAAMGTGLEAFLVRSTGNMLVSTRIVGSTFIHSEIPVNINSALSLHPAGNVTLKGNSTISGYNHDVPTDFDCNGSGCAGSLNGTDDALGIYSETNVGDLNTIGSPTLEGAPAATQTGGGAYNQNYWNDYADNVSSLATIHNGEDANGNINWGTRDNPVIHVIDQSMMINASLDGAGILIISANVIINGNFHFEGLVLIVSNGPVEFTVGGTARIFGATVAASPDATIDVGVTGTPGILYSLEALTNLNNISGVRRTAWFEEKR